MDDREYEEMRKCFLPVRHPTDETRHELSVSPACVHRLNHCFPRLKSAEDLAFEEDILRNPFSVKHWMRYASHKKDSTPEALNMVYERALRELPGSYKLWIAFLRQRVAQISGKPATDPTAEDVNNCFERSLVFMHKMPRIWITFAEFLMSQNRITRCRRTLDRALQALPITQHNRVWPLYLRLIREYDIPETAVRLYKRYLKLQPEEAEDYVQYLIGVERVDEAAVQLARVVNRDDWVSKAGKSRHQLWTELADIICKNPDKVCSLNSEAILREGIKRYTDEQAMLWISLAEYHIRSGLFDKARDVYEEAVLSVMTIKDFSQVFDAYAQSEEQLIKAKMDSESVTDEDDADLELRLARYEELIERRPLLLNSVALRQNPHNVDEWHKRVALLESKPAKVVEVFTEAVQTVDPKQSSGKLHTLWISFAKFYEKADQLEDSRVIFERATQTAFTRVEELAAVWCEWAEMELRHDHWKAALALMHRATAAPPGGTAAKRVGYYDASETAQNRLHKSLKVWSMFADLEESFGTFTTTKAVYDRIIELRIATPQIIINYGLFLEELNYFEEAFKAYEKGVSLFRWPNVYDIWNTYLTKFMDRYKGSKLERARDLFEQCLADCPAKYAKTIYLLYAKCEEAYGLAKHAMNIYDRAVEAVPADERFDMYNVFVRKASQMFGVTHTRQIYEKAIDALSDSQAQEMCVRFAELERKLGEIDRARAIYGHCSQMCDPRTSANFWNTWKEFEIKHGNEDTIREMLRIKRSVAATFNTQVNYMSAQMLAAVNPGGGQPSDAVTRMSALESSVVETNADNNMRANQQKSAVMFVKSTTKAVEEIISSKRWFREKCSEVLDLKRKTTESKDLLSVIKALFHGFEHNIETVVKVFIRFVDYFSFKTANPDEIDINDDDEDEEEDADDGEDTGAKKSTDIQQKMVPREVFGSLRPEEEDD
ncbi:unnamed protein product [Oppiella nova]|uniref:Uncharacterized protein n=1 Tax=Oppiella nova TaxID=334625 RepID=A0A7R9LDS9_9ACAR|nr:unnamed protein product [Oppiella nova]CAG2162641.1 unnamed protein product [Oppiella nova]